MENEEKVHADGNEEMKEEKTWTEEFQVAGDELIESIKKIAKEAGVRRIVVKNRHGRELLNLPLILGVAGIVWLPAYSALALVAALVAECSVIVERAESAGA